MAALKVERVSFLSYLSSSSNNKHEPPGTAYLRQRYIVVWGGGADSRVVKSLDCGARGPGFESRCRRKVLGSDGIIRKYLPL